MTPKILHIVECFSGGVYYFLKDLLNQPQMECFEMELLYGMREPLDMAEVQRDFPRVCFTRWPAVQREIRPIRDMKALREVLGDIRRIRPDLIHCHSSKAGALSRVAVLFGGMRQRLVYSPHGLSFLKRDDPLWKRRIYRGIEWFCSKLGGTVVGCSPSEADALREAGIPATMIQSGTAYDPNLYPKQFDSPPMVVNVGRISVPKNPSLFNEIANTLPNLKFVWVGDGELRDQLTAPNIEVTGWKERSEIAGYLSKAHLYLSTSLWEGLPLAVLEAMSAGMPLLLSSCVGNVDLVNGENGYLYQGKKEAIQRLIEMIEDPKRLAKLGLASRRLVEERFTLDEMARRYRELYLSKLRSASESPARS
jgi:glycosyltransferase involved in cell wall biosynthesis